MHEHVILLVGSPGAGKTAAINAVSELDADADGGDLDYGEITLGPSEKVRLYGVPARKRHDFMWSILGQRAVGLLVLVRGDAPDPVADLLDALEQYREIHERGGVVVGLTRADAGPGPALAELEAAVAERFPGSLAPCFTLDVADRDQLVVMLSVLAANIDGRALFARD